MKSATNVTYSLFGLLASMVSSFFLVPLLTNVMGVEAYGYVGLGQAFISIAKVLSVSITSLSTRYIVVAYHESSSKAATYFNSMLLACAAMACVMGAGFLVLALNVEFVMNVSTGYIDEVRAMIGFMAGSFCLSVLACPFLSAQYYRGDLRAYYSFTAASELARVAAPAVLFSVVGPSLWLPYAASFIIDAVAIGCYLMIFKRMLPDVRIDKTTARLNAVREVAAGGVWASVNKAAGIMFSSLSRYVVNLVLGVMKAGYYATFAQFQTLFSSFTNSLVGALVPSMIKVYAVGEGNAFERLFERYLKYIAIALGMLCGVALVYLDPFFGLWVGEGVSQYSIVAAMMIAFLPLVYPVEILNQVLVIQVRIKIPALVTLGIGVANIALMVLFSTVCGWDLIGIVLAQMITLIIRSWVFMPAYVSGGFNASAVGIYRKLLYGPAMMVVSLAISVLVSLVAPAATSWFVLFVDCAICVILSGIAALPLLGREGRMKVASILESLPRRGGLK